MFNDIMKKLLLPLILIAACGVSQPAHAGDEIEIEIPGYGKIKIRKKDKELVPAMPTPGEEPDFKVNCDDDNEKNDRWYWDTDGDGIFDWVWDPYRRQMWWLKPTLIQPQMAMYGPLAMLLPYEERFEPELRQYSQCPMLAVVPEPALIVTSGFISPDGVPLVDGAVLYELYGVSEEPEGDESVQFATDVTFDLTNLTVRGWMPWNPHWSTALPAYTGLEFVAETVPSSVGDDFVAINFDADIFAMAGWALDSGMTEFRLNDPKLGAFMIKIDDARRVTLNGVFVGLASQPDPTERP